MNPSTRIGRHVSGKRGCGKISAVLIAMLASVSAEGADYFNGQRIYQSHCEACHGTSGNGAMPGTPNFTTGHTLMQPDISLYYRIRDGRNAMPGYRGILSETEILDVISYLRTFY